MEDTKLNLILDNLRNDLDFLMRNHYSMDEGSFQDLKQKANAAYSSIDSLQTLVNSLSKSDTTQNTKIEKNIQDITTHSNLFVTTFRGIDYNANSISQINARLDEMDVSIANLRGDVASLQLNIDANTTNISTNTTDIADHESRIATLESAGASGSCGTNSNADLTQIEADIATNTTNIATNASDIDALETSVSTNTQNIATNTANIETNTTNIANNTQQITTNTANIQTNTTNITNNTANIATNTTNIATNTTNIGANTNAITSLQTQINALVSPYDPYYVGESFSDYPAGTIIQTYDYYERLLNMTSTGTVTLPTVYFCAEVSSNATIKVSIDYKMSLIAVDCLVQIYLNSTLVSEETITASTIDTTLNYYKELYDQVLNTTEKGNNIYVKMSLAGASNTSRTFTVLEQKIEFLAPNADVINKVCPFDAVAINGTYYVSDCKTGIAKLANISQSNINNIDNLEWTATNIEANRYDITFDFEMYDSSFIVGQLGALLVTKNNSFRLYFPDSSYDYAVSSVKFMSPLPVKNDKPAFCFISTANQICIYSANLSSNSVSRISGISNTNYVDIKGARGLFDYCGTKDVLYNFIAIDVNGIATLYSGHSTISKNIELGYFTSSSLYITDYVSSSNYKAVCYLKKFDKIIKKVFQYTYDAGFTILSTTEIGSYENYFRMTNNDYFVVKNGQLLYFKDNA